MSDFRSRPRDDLEDLGVLARRGRLSSTEQRAFEQALDTSSALRASYQVGCDFDRIGAVRPGDDALIARVVERVTAKPKRFRARRRARWVGLTLAATLAAGSAAAVWGPPWLPQSSPPPAHSTEPAPPAHAPPARPRTTRPLPPSLPTPSADPVASSPPLDAQPVELTAPATPTTPPLSAESSVPERRTQTALPTPTPTAPAATPESTAAILFRDANRARRDGQTSRAIALYTELEQRFPGSEEARLSYVSLGKLLLASGRAAEADRKFAAYLAGGGRALAEEALVGRAQSLRQLGRTGEERRIWQTLLREFPSSVYAAQARRRLTELDTAK